MVIAEQGRLFLDTIYHWSYVQWIDFLKWLDKLKYIKRYKLYREAYIALDNEAVATWTYDPKLTQRQQLKAVIDWNIRASNDPALKERSELVKDIKRDSIEATLKSEKFFSDLTDYTKEQITKNR